MYNVKLGDPQARFGDRSHLLHRRGLAKDSLGG